MKLTERLKIIARNRRRHEPVANVSAGRAAELKLAAVLDERFRGSRFEYAAGLRIPERKRRREVDFVITAPDEIWAVELKNWSGFVRLDGSKVIQHRAGGRGVVDHGRLVADLRRKERALKRYLRRRLDEVPDIWTILVFANDGVGIDEELRNIDGMDVMGLREFLGALPVDEAEAGGVWGAIRRLFGGVEKAESRRRLPEITESVRKTRKVLLRLGTWDLMMLYGGRIISGDVVGFSIDELADRDRFRRLEVDVPRSWFHALRAELAVGVRAIERNGDAIDYECGFDETIQFHAAGQPRPQSYPLRDVVGLSFGYTERD